MSNSRPTQCDRLLDYMNNHKSITQHEALFELGIARLASRISELKKMGYEILTEFVKVKSRYGEVSVAAYSLAVRE